MENNYHQVFLQELFKKLVEINGQIFHFSEHLKQYQKVLINNIPQEREFLVSTLAIRDMTLDQESDVYYNLHPLNYKYSVDQENLILQNERLVSRECGYQISQAYEELENYLYQIISTHIYRNRPLAGIDESLNFCSSKEEILKNLRGAKNRKNNKHLLRYLRIISNEYKSLEKVNWRRINLAKWFNAFSEIRHSVVHRSHVLDSSIIDKMDTVDLSIYKNHFPLKKSENNCTLNLNYNNANKVFIYTSEFAYLVFKSLSVDYNLEWDVLPKIIRLQNR